MSSELQFQVLSFLDSNPQLSQRGLTKSLGVSLGGVNYYLNALVSKGLIKIQNFKNNQNKCVYAYLLTPQGLAEKTAVTGSFFKRKIKKVMTEKRLGDLPTYYAQTKKVKKLLVWTASRLVKNICKATQIFKLSKINI